MNKVTGLNQSGCSASVMTTIPVACILLEDARLPDEASLIETLRVRHPGLRWDRSPVAPSNDTDGPMFIRVGDHLMTILLMPAPMPYDQQLWQRASWVWPGGFPRRRPPPRAPRRRDNGLRRRQLRTESAWVRRECAPYDCLCRRHA